jgi:D-beta-D-heptose 7-phosphate kinase/D-beta-D-heptose 1-phosphate adenosyltransferase
MTPTFDRKSLGFFLSTCRSDGRRVVFTNGVFDILHVGHVTYLEAARSLGDALVVGVNSDASVRRLNKGPERPINPELARAQVLRALRCVDAVVIFDDDTPYTLIAEIEPDVLVKGGDYDPDELDASSKRYMVGSDLVRAKGGIVAAIPLVDGFSTTAIINKTRSV